MKIAYIALLPGKRIGIEAHIAARARAARKVGAEIDFIIVGPEPGASPSLVQYIPYPAPIVSGNYVRTLFRRYEVIARVLRGRSYDRVVLRYPGGDPSGAEFAERFAVITEHHTKELTEFESKFNSGLPKLEGLMKRVRHRMEARYGPAVLAHCRGFLAMTQEIEQFERQRRGGPLSSAVVSNGVDVDKISPTGFKAFDGKALDIAFLAGSIDPARVPWHGLDRVLEGLSRYHGSVFVRLHVIGNASAAVRPARSESWQTVFHSARDSAALDEILCQMHVGISTLALHRKGMTQACPFKTREYLCRGLPFLTAYEDADLIELASGREYYRRFAAVDEPIDIESVIDFAAGLTRSGSASTLATEMRALARTRVDWTIKVSEVLAFLQDC